MTRLFRNSLSTTLVFSLLLAACDSGGSGSPSVSQLVGKGGGILRVTDGPLAGTTLVIPIFALSEDVIVTIGEGNMRPQPDAFAIGPATRISPSELGLAHDASAILVYDADEVPAATPLSDFVVKRSDARGRITDLAPDLVKPEEGTLLVLLPELSTYCVAIKGSPFSLADYWPMHDGDTYEFDNGVVLALSRTAGEPQINQPIVKATFVTAAGDTGWYLDPASSGETYLLGRFSVTEGFQELGNQPLMLLPDYANLGDSGQTECGMTGFEPFGATVSSYSAREELTTTLVSGGVLNTPLGQFSDVIEIEIVCDREDSTAGGTITSSSVVDRLWLARGIGPVHIALQGLPRGQVTGGVVAGKPLGK